MAGVMSRNVTATDKLRKVMDGVSQDGTPGTRSGHQRVAGKIRCEQTGDIRFGLAAIKGVGANAVNAIIQERNANGMFKDIYDFCGAGQS